MTDLRETTTGDQPGEERPPSWSRRPLVACVLLGVGLGGFVDGIVLHQILQWHHMLTATGDHPADTVAGLEANTLADGLFHAATWVFVVAGIVVLRRAWAAGRPAPTVSAQLGGVLAGWGIFNLVEGLVDHHLLGVHEVRDDVADPLWWNLGFLAFGALLVAVGVALLRRRPRSTARAASHRAGSAPASVDGNVHRRQPGEARAVVKGSGRVLPREPRAAEV